MNILWVVIHYAFGWYLNTKNSTVSSGLKAFLTFQNVNAMQTIIFTAKFIMHQNKYILWIMGFNKKSSVKWKLT